MGMQKTTDVSAGKISVQDLFDFLFQFSFQNNYSVAVWQLPGTSTKEIILSQTPVTVSRDQFLEEMPGGFVFAPFNRSEKSLFIPADLHFTIEGDTLKDPVTPRQTNSHQWLHDNYSKNSGPTAAYYVDTAENTTDKQSDFLSIVREGILEIEKGTFEKVVPSRRKAVDLPKSFDLASAFLKLCHAYAQAFVSLISSPETGTWMGATPEELVRVEDKIIFRTVALAGTQPYHEGVNLRKVAWTQKEIEEQALVERYIISCFKKIRLREYDEHGPKTIVAGNLMHLRSDFTVNMKETNFPQLGSTMLQLLHPTSAVCGMPLDTAFDFLAAHEGYHRKFYSGYLGPVNISNHIDIFVNLRCMQLLQNKAILYAGAGVTIDSVPEQEWEETEMKMNTLLRVIQ
jgi:isochorismate synthase